MSENIMKTVYQFFLAMKIPTVTAQEHRIVPSKNGKRPLVFDSPELAAARATYIAYLNQHRPEKKLSGALALRIVWCFKTTAKHKHGDWKITKPDTDNMIKLFKDCMTKVGFWNDDAQISWELQEKRYNEIEGIYVQISQLS